MEPILKRSDELVKSFIEITLPDQENFLKIKETLTRIGIASKKENVLFQSCHILHKKGKFYIVHFKELFQLDGKVSSIDEKDIARRNTIVHLLSDWGLCVVVDPAKAQPVDHLNSIKILSFGEKKEWSLVPKYNIGKKKV